MTVNRWLAEAWEHQVQPNPNAIVLATSDPDGRPSARVVLCKEIVAEPGYLVFYTNYLSRKGRQLARNPRAAAVIHWDALHRQVRVEGPILEAPAADSDAYFASRPLAESRRRVGERAERAGGLARGATGSSWRDGQAVRPRQILRATAVRQPQLLTRVPA